jgi:hypothetical protein
MIDNQKQVTALIRDLKTHLPVPAKATKSLCDLLRRQSIDISPDTSLEIVDVVYMGDEGGICCAIQATNQEKAAVVVSLTHLSLPPNNQLAKSVTAYQTQRVKKLAKLNR